MPEPESSATPRGHWVVERPESGLARGQVAVPPWAIALFGALAIALALGLIYRHWRAR